jgi:phosphate transport system substrate-binding protein
MAKRSGPPPIVFILLFLALLGGAYWFFFRRPQTATTPTQTQPEAVQPGTTQTPTAPAAPANFALQPNVPAGTTVSIDGSTSMVLINEALKAGFQQQYPGTTVNTNATGSDNGIQALLSGSADLGRVFPGLNPPGAIPGIDGSPRSHRCDRPGCRPK